MDKLKQWVTLTVLAALVIAAGGWFLLVSPQRAEATALNEQAAAQDSSNAALQNTLAVLKAQSLELPAEQAKLAAVTTKIPATPELPSLIYALTKASDDSGVQFLSLTPGEPVAKTVAVAPVVNEDGTTVAAAPVSSLQVIPVTIGVNGGYFETQRFLAALEDLPRALRVTVLGLAPGANPLEPTTDGSSTELDGSRLTTNITAEIYLSSPVTLAATPAAPAATPADPAVTPGTEPTVSPVPTPTS